MTLHRRQHLLIILSFFQLTYASRCYWPNGQMSDPTYVVCNSTAPVSACCDSPDPCTTEGWCLGSAGFTYRGGCTDSTWSSGVCQNFCKEVSSTFANVLYCGDINATSPAGQYCCSIPGESLVDCCQNKQKVFQFPSVESVNGLTGRAFVLDVAKGNLSPSTTSSTQSNTASATGTSAATQTSTGQPLTSPRTGVSSGGASSSAVAGAAVGALVGGILIGLLTAWIYSTQRTLKNYQQPVSLPSHEPVLYPHQTVSNGQVMAVEPKPELATASPPYNNYFPGTRAEVQG